MSVLANPSLRNAEVHAPCLRAPRTLEESGLEQALLADLAARLLLLRGRLSLEVMAAHLKLPPSLVGETLSFLRTERAVEVARQEGFESSAIYQLTEQGRAQARDALGRCQYAGAAPVTLKDYCAVVEANSLRHAQLSAPVARQALKDLILAPEIVDRIGAAMNSRRPVLLYGPAGSGKTFLAENLAALLPGEIPVPYALTVGGEIIQVFDPLLHCPVARRESGGLVHSGRDERWVHCGRPVVIAGGELTLQMLDLQFDPTTRYYQAPPHVKANGGIFVVDDLGRQLVAPRDLMNRWIVPLDRNRDYLALHTGFKFAVPFDLTVIFSTNLRPARIADEAFMRRFGSKVYLGPLDAASYRRVFERTCSELGVAFDAAALEWMIAERHLAQGKPLLACYPRDLAGRVRDFALYTGAEPKLSREALDRAWTTYFCPEEPGALPDLMQT